METFNTICVSYPKVKSLSEARKNAIRARLRTYSMDDLKKAFEAMEQSEFLQGNNNSDWSANFDWVMKIGTLQRYWMATIRIRRTKIMNQTLKIGDQHRIITSNFSGMAKVTNVKTVDTKEQKGVLVEYLVENYGQSADFFVPDGAILDGQIDSVEREVECR